MSNNNNINKFRVWNKKTNSWIFDDCYMDMDGCVYVEEESAFSGPYFDRQDPRDIVVQRSTGLLDTNGKLMYEGDIVAEVPDEDQDNTYEYRTTENNREIFTIAWVQLDNDILSFCTVRKDGLPDCSRGGLGYDPNDLEVIGNIYENPELMKKVKIMRKELAKISNAKLSMDRNILSFYIFVDYESGCSQGVGGYALDEYNKEHGDRIGTAYGCHMIRSILNLFEVNDLSELKGKYVYVLFDDCKSLLGETPIGIQPLNVDNYGKEPLIFADVHKMFEKE